MIWLVFSIVLTTLFFVLFKLFAVFKINTFQAIVFNYITCVIVGFSFAHDADFNWFWVNKADWGAYALILGCLFISTFFLMAVTAQKVSVAVSTVASKISMVIPSAISLFLFPSLIGEFKLANWLGFGLSFVALILVTYSSKTTEEVKWGAKEIALILLVFVGTGLVDTFVNLASKNFPSDNFSKGFPIFCFIIAAVGGSIVSLFKKDNQFEWRNVVAGIVLGIPNYFSIYSLIKALEHYKGNAAFVFPVANISVIVASSFIAFLFFKERLSKVNYLGVFLALSAVVLLSL